MGPFFCYNIRMIQATYLAVYLGFNVFFGIFFIIGIRGIVKFIQFKKRKKNFTIPAKVKYMYEEKIKDSITGYVYRRTYKIDVKGTMTEGTLNTIPNVKVGMSYPADNKWHDVMVNPENHSEFRLPCEDNAIHYYKWLAIVFIIYGTFFRLLFEFAIWGPFLSEGGLR